MTVSALLDAAGRRRSPATLPGFHTGRPGLLALVFIWGPIPATRNPLEMLLFTILAFVGAHVLRGQIAEEFPGAQPASIRAPAR